MLAEARYYSRMAIGIAEMLRTQPPAAPHTMLREQFLRREEHFLRLAEQVVFAQPDHPYHRMFRHAGCSFGDLAQLVKSSGLEAALLQLRGAGVYLSHDEFKGKVPVVRGGESFSARPASFANPLVKGWMQSSSSGSRGTPVRSAQSTMFKLHREAYSILRIEEFGLAERAQVEVKAILPSTSGLNPALRAKRLGTKLERWFVPGSNPHYRAATAAMVALGNLLGAGAPFPQYLPPNDFSPVVDFLAQRQRAGHLCSVRGFASPLSRIAAAARERGVSLDGAYFFTGGEPLTPGKRTLIESTGAEAYPSYATSEVGHIGEACRQIRTGNCVHVFEDSVAAISFRRKTPLYGVEVDSLHFSTLLPYAPYVFINVEMDDVGVLSRKACDCVYGRLGFTLQVAEIGSFGKLTGQGVTLVGTDLVKILEESLPARLGGAPGDYQLVETDRGGQTDLQLYVSPRTGVVDPTRVEAVFLELLKSCYGGSLADRLWGYSKGFQVILAEPLATGSGKVHPLHLLGTGTADRFNLGKSNAT